MEQKKKHSHGGHRERMKTKALEAGIEHWPEHEVLELILMYSIPQRDVNPLAHTLLETFGSLAGVLDAGYTQLEKIDGIGKQTALFLSLLPEFFVRYTASKMVGEILMKESYQAVNYFRATSRVREVEEFYVFCLNNKKVLTKTIKFGSSLFSAVGIPKNEFAVQVALSKCKTIIVLHTHPNGDCNPTDNDIKSTKLLIEAANAVGVELKDHLIVTEREYFSFLKNGLINKK